MSRICHPQLLFAGKFEVELEVIYAITRYGNAHTLLKLKNFTNFLLWYLNFTHALVELKNKMLITKSIPILMCVASILIKLSQEYSSHENLTIIKLCFLTLQSWIRLHFDILRDSTEFRTKINDIIQLQSKPGLKDLTNELLECISAVKLMHKYPFLNDGYLADMRNVSQEIIPVDQGLEPYSGLMCFMINKSHLIFMRSIDNSQKVFLHSVSSHWNLSWMCEVMTVRSEFDHVDLKLASKEPVLKIEINKLLTHFLVIDQYTQSVLDKCAEPLDDEVYTSMAEFKKYQSITHCELPTSGDKYQFEEFSPLE